MSRLLPALALLGCGGSDAPNPAAPIDLTAPLGADEARAGMVTDEAALFGGVAAEGRSGDFKIYNDRVQFVIQGLREGDYYVPESGNVVDADIVRPEGEPGRDIVDDWAVNFGVGQLLDAQRVWVAADGSDGGPAIVMVQGHSSPMLLLEGAVEGWGMIPDLGLEVTQSYILHPGSWLLEVHTSMRATDLDAAFQPGDVIIGSNDAAVTWTPGEGLGANTGALRPWTGYVAERDDVAVAVLGDAGAETEPGVLEAFASLIDVAAAFAPDDLVIPAGGSATYTRLYGVGPDLATLSDAALERRGDATQVVEGIVDASDGPVAGARVNIMVDGEPYSLARSDAEGRFRALAPAGAQVSTVVDATGPTLVVDLPMDAGHFSPYAAQPARALTLDGYSGGTRSFGLPQPRGRGVSQPGAPATVEVPGTVVVDVADDLPFEVRLRALDAPPVVDARLVRARESGYASAAWSRGGPVSLQVAPGTYELVVHRGQRFERHVEEVVLASGATLDRAPELARGFQHDGWLLGDPHCHASPSPDGHIPMEHRLLNQAAVGVQVHFGTDHDHIADYRPLLEPLGLADVLATVVATEVSPVVRGHKNAYPLTPDDSAPNRGAFRWWAERVEDTSDEFARLRARYDPQDLGMTIQINHPVGLGLADFADWEPGLIADGDYWSSDFEAMEVLNGGHTGEYLPVYFDLVARGHRLTPVGVTDSHRPFSGDPGLNGTYYLLGDDPGAYTDDALRAAMAEQRVIATRGAFLEMSILPGSTVGAGQTLSVEARSSSWVPVERVVLYRDGEPSVTVQGAVAEFALDAAADAFYVVMAESDTDLGPPYSGRTAWAMSAPIYLDVAGDGWDPPLPALVIETR